MNKSCARGQPKEIHNCGRGGGKNPVLRPTPNRMTHGAGGREGNATFAKIVCLAQCAGTSVFLVSRDLYCVLVGEKKKNIPKIYLAVLSKIRTVCFTATRPQQKSKPSLGAFATLLYTPTPVRCGAQQMSTHLAQRTSITPTKLCKTNRTPHRQPLTPTKRGSF